ncbi:DUF6215 domain-containing protein [Streptomyces sp. NBC_00820]|uniref:DUF6215 domain-containing protein n=1 Tax=Streptomyces sp. NBC_00820 TaxID=2975842 RepID=UPI002ED64EC7|nr:DUF6215 domain-containing protein [Streptomyces sp. NBC_00820]
MTDGSASEKGHNAGVQAVVAVLVVGGALGGLWAQGELQGNTGDKGPATCSHDDRRVSRHVSGHRLCTALNRPNLPVLLGAPDETAQTANGSSSSFALPDGTKVTTPTAEVDTQTFSVQLTAPDDRAPVAETAGLMGMSAQKTTLLGHPAVLYSDHTIAIRFSLGGGDTDADTSTGGIARHLLVARDREDGGGSYELALWRQDNGTPDDAALLRVAEQVLPRVPGWAAG